MPRIVAIEIAKGVKYSTSFDKTIATRVWHVDASDSTPSAMAYAAANFDGIPKRGQYHPTLNALACRSISAQPYGDSSPTLMVVTAEYGSELDKAKSEPSHSGPCTLDYGPVTANLKVFRGKRFTTSSDEFAPMILYFYDPNTATLTPDQITAAAAAGIDISDLQNHIRAQPCEIDIQAPMPLVTFRRNEPADGFDYIALKLAFEGRINSRPFIGGDSFTWMCVKIDAQLKNDHFECAYSFQYHGGVEPYSWLPIFVFKEYSGKGRKGGGGPTAYGAPADGVTFENGGIDQFQVHRDADFNLMGLRVS